MGKESKGYKQSTGKRRRSGERTREGLNTLFLSYSNTWIDAKLLTAS
jgi:hypothetical protein